MRRIVIRVGAAAVAGALLLTATACGRDEEALAREYEAGRASAPAAGKAAAPSTPAATTPAAKAAPSLAPPAATTAPEEPPPALPPIEESSGPTGAGNGSDPAAQSRLDAALLTAAEMPAGAYDGSRGDPESRERAQQPSCQAVIDLLRPGQAATAPIASAQASVTRGDPNPTGFTVVELFAFTDAGARDLFAQGRRALRGCPSITSIDADGATETDTYAEIPHAALGDESLAVGMSPGAGGALGMIVVRVGPTIVVVSNADLAAATPGLPADDLVARQIAKLRTAGG
ncbi:sensor domain-containing protein [Embleya hyalina]|uniref:Lipoprotein n=1 Tax=Embleya hyalina TaxID=516124 RepID=A0A401Z2A4_9ACTN|nr:sensor domain-containing protein [Embleya hyalina]GCE00954.1 hypothetical protein EHYA_08683 [Embleya hyalina]